MLYSPRTRTRECVRGLASAASRHYDAIIIGGGHNGLVAGAYLGKAGKRVLILERRHLVGGAAVTEELFPGFKYSRASYVYSLFRPHIVRDLDLHRRGLKLLPRVPSSFTPQVGSGAPSLLLGGGPASDAESIAQFSTRDAGQYGKYNAVLDRYSDAFRPLLDRTPPEWPFGGSSSSPPPWPSSSGSTADSLRALAAFARDGGALARSLGGLGRELPAFVNFLLAPATKTLDGWFESDILKATLATDAVIGSMSAPSTPQSSYVLLHHVMCGTWSNVQGGMGALSAAIAAAASAHGATIRTNADVKRILVDHTLPRDASALERAQYHARGGASARGSAGARVTGVEMVDGAVYTAPTVIANAAPYTVFTSLLGHAPDALPPGFLRDVGRSIGPSGAVKINVALDALPNFSCRPNADRYEVPAAAGAYGTSGPGAHWGGSPPHQRPLPHHRGTIHFETRIGQIDAAFADALGGTPSARPVVEMTLPSVLDPTIAPPGKHVALLFCQYAPYTLKGGKSWDEVPGSREAFADAVFRVIEEHAPGFTASVLHRDILAPPDLERVFGLPRGNIFQAPMGLDALLWNRPVPGYARYRSPIRGLYMASAGTHPGGGVIGAPGANCAREVLRDAGLA